MTPRIRCDFRQTYTYERLAPADIDRYPASLKRNSCLPDARRRNAGIDRPQRRTLAALERLGLPGWSSDAHSWHPTDPRRSETSLLSCARPLRRRGVRSDPLRTWTGLRRPEHSAVIP